MKREILQQTTKKFRTVQGNTLKTCTLLSYKIKRNAQNSGFIQVPKVKPIRDPQAEQTKNK